jgi:hypothetical protein
MSRIAPILLVLLCVGACALLVPNDRRFVRPIMLEFNGSTVTALPIGDGLALTVGHYSGPKVAEHPTLDIAIVEVGEIPDFAGRPPVRLSEPIFGEELFCIGFPLGGPLTITSGFATARVGRASVDVALGNSGSPIYDAQGRLVGLMTGLELEWGPSGWQIVDHLAFYVPICQVWDWVLEQVSQG